MTADEHLYFVTNIDIPGFHASASLYVDDMGVFHATALSQTVRGNTVPEVRAALIVQLQNFVSRNDLLPVIIAELGIGVHDGPVDSQNNPTTCFTRSAYVNLHARVGRLVGRRASSSSMVVLAHRNPDQEDPAVFDVWAAESAFILPEGPKAREMIERFRAELMTTVERFREELREVAIPWDSVGPDLPPEDLNG